MPDPLALSLLNDHLYCPRRAALKMIEGWRSANAHTERGDIVHEHADLPGYEMAKGVTLLRALPVWSERLGLNGKCDIVEVDMASTPNLKSPISDLKSSAVALRPVDFKLGKRRQWENDDVQVCAQALCLEEMFGITVPLGAIYHASSKRRREVEFTADLRLKTETAARELQSLMNSQTVPPAVFKPACEECSLFEVCLPRAAGNESRAARLARELFQI